MRIVLVPCGEQEDSMEMRDIIRDLDNYVAVFEEEFEVLKTGLKRDCLSINQAVYPLPLQTDRAKWHDLPRFFAGSFHVIVGLLLAMLPDCYDFNPFIDVKDEPLTDLEEKNAKYQLFKMLRSSEHRLDTFVWLCEDHLSILKKAQEKRRSKK